MIEKLKKFNCKSIVISLLIVVSFIMFEFIEDKKLWCSVSKCRFEKEKECDVDCEKEKCEKECKREKCEKE